MILLTADLDKPFRVLRWLALVLLVATLALRGSYPIIAVALVLCSGFLLIAYCYYLVPRISHNVRRRFRVWAFCVVFSCLTIVFSTTQLRTHMLDITTGIIVGLGIALAWYLAMGIIIPVVDIGYSHIRTFAIPGTCEHCGYDVTGNLRGICPECGRRIASERAGPPSQGPKC